MRDHVYLWLIASAALTLWYMSTHYCKLCCHPFLLPLLNGTCCRFYRVGGGTRMGGFVLALATVVLILVGTQFIAFIRMSRMPFCALFSTVNVFGSCHGCWRADICPWHRPCQRGSLGHETSC